MKIYNYLTEKISQKGAAFLILLDPDKIEGARLKEFIHHSVKAGVDAFLAGGSLLMNGDLKSFILSVKEITNVPVIIFPGALNQIHPEADALLYLSVISGRNPEHLIGKHVLAAPLIKRCGIEPISTGYMLIESGTRTTAEYMSGSQPIPRNKPEIAAATALAAEYMGMKFIYLEAGSGAELSVPVKMIKIVSSAVSVPVIVGGGIRTPQAASQIVEAGAKIVVVGNHLEDENNWDLVSGFADAVHWKSSVTV